LVVNGKSENGIHLFLQVELLGFCKLSGKKCVSFLW